MDIYWTGGPSLFDDGAMTRAPADPAKQLRRDADGPDDRKARLAAALRANLKRRKEAGATTRKPDPAGQKSETGS